MTGFRREYALCTERPFGVQSRILAPVLNAVHSIDMRTRANVNIDDDAYSAATAFAAARGIALGAAISELIRRGEQAAELPLGASGKLKRDQYGFLVVKAAGPVITSEMAREGSEDDFE
jgi:hypothetical protein